MTSHRPATLHHRWINRLLELFYRAASRWAMQLLYQPEFRGFEQIPPQGPAILICNHVSYVDGLLIQSAVGRPVRFVIARNIYELPVVHYFMRMARTIPIEATREGVTHALEEVSAALRAGELVGIFPEGRLTPTGSLSRFKPGIEWILKQDPVPLYPMAIIGLWGSIFSRKYRTRWFPWWPRRFPIRVKLLCGAPMTPQEVHINMLQEQVLRLKYQLNQPGG